MPAVPPISPAFVARILAVHGDAGRAWLDGLPGTIERWRHRWDLGPLAPFPLSYSWVAATERRDGTACVLKLSPPGQGILDAEARWLELAGGRGAVRVLRNAAADGALLLERADPGTLAADLVAGDDDAATLAIAAVIGRLGRPAPAAAGLPTLAGRAAELQAHLDGPGPHPLPPAAVAGAARLADELLASAPAPVLLHGDLHHDNVLADRRRGWLAIDPHGLTGDPAYEPAALLYNPFDHDGVAALAERRIALLAGSTGLDEERVRGWGHVQAVLSAVWSLDEDPAPDEHVLAVARRLAPR